MSQEIDSPTTLKLMFDKILENNSKDKFTTGEGWHARVGEWFFGQPMLESGRRANFRRLFGDFLSQYCKVIEERLVFEIYPESTFDFGVFKTLRANLLEIADTVLEGKPPYARYLGPGYGDGLSNPTCIKLLWCIAGTETNEIKISWSVFVVPGLGKGDEPIAELYSSKLAS